MNGITICFDILGADKDKLENINFLENLMFSSCASLLLRPIKVTKCFVNLPVICNKTGHGTGDIGITGTMILKESHIAIHTWPEHKYARMEISSCKKIDMQDIINLSERIRKSTNASIVKISTIDWKK